MTCPWCGGIRHTCPNHPEGQVCASCVADKTTDGLGFPHPSSYEKGLVALKRCGSCGDLVPRERWNRETWTCTGCVPRVA